MSPIPSSTSSSNTSRWIKTLRFIALVCLLAYSFQYFFEKKIILGSESAAAYKVNRILYGNDETEIPIFGPSTAQGGLIPDLLNPHCFNYGMDGVREDVLLFFLKEECKKTRKNPHILLVLSPDGLSYSLGDLNNYILNSNNPDVRDLLGANYKLYYKMPLVKYYGQCESYFKDYLNERMMLTKYKDKGASVEKDVLTKERFNSLVEERKNTITIFKNDSGLEKAFVSLVRDHPQRTFVIIIPPVHPSYFYRYKNYDEALRFFTYLAGFPNIRVLNYSHQFYPDDYYVNTMHLNYTGAVAFNNLLKDSLQKIISE